MKKARNVDAKSVAITSSRRADQITDADVCFDQPRQSNHRRAFVSKIFGDQIVRPPASANVDPGSGGAYPITVGIERVQKARLIRTGIWLNAPQRAFVYKKRCLYRAIVSPKSHGMPRPVI
jgi:hypothetical protein